MLKHLVDRGPACPKVLAATHFHDVFTADLLDPEAVPITFLHMQVLFTSSSGEVLEDASRTLGTPGSTQDDTPRIGPGEQITYLYR